MTIYTLIIVKDGNLNNITNYKSVHNAIKNINEITNNNFISQDLNEGIENKLKNTQYAGTTILLNELH